MESGREEWERIFAIDWWGVYYCARAFLPLLIASGNGVLVNTSSVNGFWASLGPGMPQTAYSTAKFAVRGFTEALIEDLRSNAPQVRVALVLPGHVGTNIVRNSLVAQGLPAPENLSDAQAEEIFRPSARDALARAGVLPEKPTGEDLRRFLVQANADFRDKAPVSAAQAATIILDGVRAGTWRILIGKDAKMIDERVRAMPEAAYDYAELFAGLTGSDSRPDERPGQCRILPQRRAASWPRGLPTLRRVVLPGTASAGGAAGHQPLRRLVRRCRRCRPR